MIETEQLDDVAILRMVYGKANALDIALCEALVAQFEELRNSSARAVVITAPGSIFSAGVDLLRALDGGADYLRKFLPALHRLYDTIFFYPKPVIAAINGHAVAGGCVLACAADRRLMAREAGRIGVTELLVGLPFPALAFEIMRSVAAPAHFEAIIFSGATYAPQDAAARGLIDEIVAPAALVERAIAVAQARAALSPPAFALTKERSRAPVHERMQRDGARYDAKVEAIWTAPDTAARIQDYVSRTFRKR